MICIIESQTVAIFVGRSETGGIISAKLEKKKRGKG